MNKNSSSISEVDKFRQAAIKISANSGAIALWCLTPPACSGLVFLGWAISHYSGRG